MNKNSFELLEEGRLDYSEQANIVGGGILVCVSDGVKIYNIDDDGNAVCPVRYRSCSMAEGRITCSLRDEGYKGQPGSAGYYDDMTGY